MRRKLFVALLGMAALAGLTWGLVTAGGSGDSVESIAHYKVSITNLTRGQPLSPIFLATHAPGVAPLYTLGQPASADLAALAEEADAAGLLGAWNPAISELIGAVQLVKSDTGPDPAGPDGHGHGYSPRQGAVSLPGEHVVEY